MAAEWRNKMENPVEIGRPSRPLYGGFKPTLDSRVRQPLMAKELLCGTQPANLSLVIAELRFPSYSAVLPYRAWRIKEAVYRKRKLF